MNIVVTGGTGFIGSRLVNELVSRGHIIHLLVRASSDISTIPSFGIKLFNGDITDPLSISECMKGCSAVYHLAAYAKNWAKDSSLYMKYNNTALINILDNAVKHKISRVLFMSSSVTIGPSSNYPVSETTIRSVPPFTMYEASKIEAEKTVMRYVDKGPDIITVNPTRLYGPGKLTEGNSVTRMIDLYIKGKFRFIPGDGNSAGNYAFIDDVVSGCIKAMENGKNGHRYILGGENITYNLFFDILKDLSGNKYRMFKIPAALSIPYSYAEQITASLSNHYPAITPGWVRTFCKSWAFSSEKAVSELGYKITSFKSGVQETLNWLNREALEKGEGYESVTFN